MRRVVVTGLGIISCIGNSKKEVVDSLIKALSIGLKLFGKFIGLILIIVSISMFIGLISFVLSINIIDFVNLPLSNEFQFQAFFVRYF